MESLTSNQKINLQMPQEQQEKEELADFDLPQEVQIQSLLERIQNLLGRVLAFIFICANGFLKL